LVAGGLMAALMSSLASVFNSSSTLFTVDIFKKMYPHSPELKLVRIGKIATVFVVAVGMLWIPVMEKIGGGVLYNYLQSVQSYIAPPITAVFLLGILWKRVNAHAAISTLMFGLVIATLRILAELFATESSPLAFQFAAINFSHMAIFMFIACIFVCIAVSLATDPPDFSKIRGLAFGALDPQDKIASKGSFDKIDALASIILVFIIVCILFYFTG
jgi:SSS family solute:Na+ symporter